MLANRYKRFLNALVQNLKVLVLRLNHKGRNAPSIKNNSYYINGFGFSVYYSNLPFFEESLSVEYFDLCNASQYLLVMEVPNVRRKLYKC